MLHSRRDGGSCLDTMSASDATASAAAVACYVVAVIPIGTACWAFTVLSRFTFGFKDLILTAFKLAVGKLPRTIVMALLLIEAASLSLKYVFPLAFVPALTALLTSLFTEPVFKAYGGGLKNADAEPEAPDEADGE